MFLNTSHFGHFRKMASTHGSPRYGSSGIFMTSKRRAQDEASQLNNFSQETLKTDSAVMQWSQLLYDVTRDHFPHDSPECEEAGSIWFLMISIQKHILKYGYEFVMKEERCLTLAVLMFNLANELHFGALAINPNDELKFWHQKLIQFHVVGRELRDRMSLPRIIRFCEMQAEL